ncbi:MAG: GAF domain-containing protein [Proteobacteria bacterium]|nr:GAF domain-containing protein [Pseudomonadota bacterium]
MVEKNESLGKYEEEIVDLKRGIEEARAFALSKQDLVLELVKIGTALSGQKDHERLLEMIVELAKRFTNADGCTLYIRDEKEKSLRFTIVQCDTLGVKMGGQAAKISWTPVSLNLADGSENHGNVSAHCALTGKIIKISDVYSSDFDFQGTRNFDLKNGYRSKSMLVLPMMNHDDEVIGVIQLINAQNRFTNEVMDFMDTEIEIVTCLASQAAIAITNIQLISGLEELLQSIVKMVATAIDEKSPYTGGHVQRVANFTEEIVKKINQTETGRFAEIAFNEDQAKEIKMAAWLHDVGKIITPEHIIDKSKKLETIFDRIELIKLRIELLKKDSIINRLKRKIDIVSVKPDVLDDLADEIRGLDEQFAFMQEVNTGGEFLRDESLERLLKMAACEIEVDGKMQSLLNDDELKNLCIRKGTLIDSEREVINNHAAVTLKMLEALPFPKKLAQVPVYAGMHHEKMDGSGYPQGLTAEQVPFPARILAVADVFEALTAADRPYKLGKLMSESMRIMGFMVKDNHLDSELCDLIVESGLAAAYARQYISERQQDDFVWGGKKYAIKK